MSYRILTNNAIDNTNIDGARGNHFNSGMKSGIVKGAFNEGIFFSPSSNIIALDTCELRISGHQVIIEEVEYISLTNIPATSTRYSLIAEIVVDSLSVPSFRLFIQPASSAITQDNLFASENGSGTYQIEIGKFTQTTAGIIEDVVRTIDVITGGSSAIGGDYIEIGDVVTNTLPSGSQAEVDIENVEVEGRKKTNFTFDIPAPVGTTVTVDGVEQENISFSSDPQTQINGKTVVKVNNVAQATYDATFAESERLKSLNLFNIHNPNNHNYNCSTEFLTSNELKVTQTTGTYGHISILCLNLNEYLGKTLYLSCDAEKSSSSTNTGLLFAYRTNYSTMTEAESLGGVEIQTTGHYTYSFTVPSTPYSEPKNYLSVYLYSDTNTGTTGDYIIYSNVMVSLDGNASYQSYNGNITHQNNVYPIGSIYTSVNEASPASFFGGTWERIQGKFLLSATDGSVQQEMDNLGWNRSGSNYHYWVDANGNRQNISVVGNSSGNVRHLHTLSSGYACIGQEYYRGNKLAYVRSSRSSYPVYNRYQCDVSNGTEVTTESWDIKPTALDGSTDNGASVPPYLVVYMWKRIA